MKPKFKVVSQEPGVTRLLDWYEADNLSFKGAEFIVATIEHHYKRSAFDMNLTIVEDTNE